MRYEPTDIKQYCSRCDKVVEVEQWIDRGTGHIEQRCPHCHNEDTEDILTCDICEKPMNGNMADSLFGICKDCLSDIDYAINQAVELLMKDRNITSFQAEEYILARLKETED